MQRLFTAVEAAELVPEVRRRAAEVIAVRADLTELAAALHRGRPSSLGGVAERKGLEARLDELLGWFGQHGIELKGLAPLLLDFPSVRDGEPVLLCWLEGESELGWYHRADLGFAGRRPLGPL